MRTGGLKKYVGKLIGTKFWRKKIDAGDGNVIVVVVVVVVVVVIVVVIVVVVDDHSLRRLNVLLGNL